MRVTPTSSRKVSRLHGLNVTVNVRVRARVRVGIRVGNRAAVGLAPFCCSSPVKKSISGSDNPSAEGSESEPGESESLSPPTAIRVRVRVTVKCILSRCK